MYLHSNLGTCYESCTLPFLNIGLKILYYYYVIVFLKLFGEKKFVNLVKVFPASIKLINQIQKYPHIIESYACILKIFVVMFLLSINVLISFGIWSTLKESK